jgi:hypothetical protein
LYARNAHQRHLHAVVPNPNEGAEDVAAPAPLPKVPPPNMEGFAASALGLLRPLPPKADSVDPPDVAPPPPNRPPGLLAGVLEAPPPKRFEVPVFAPPPNKVEPPDEAAPGVAALAVPNREGVEPPDVLLAAPNNGLFGVLPLFCCPKLKPDMLCD